MKFYIDMQNIYTNLTVLFFEESTILEYNCIHIIFFWNTGCPLTHGTNFDSLYKDPKRTLFQE